MKDLIKPEVDILSEVDESLAYTTSLDSSTKSDFSDLGIDFRSSLDTKTQEREWLTDSYRFRIIIFQSFYTKYNERDKLNCSLGVFFQNLQVMN